MKIKPIICVMVLAAAMCAAAGAGPQRPLDVKPIESFEPPAGLDDWQLRETTSGEIAKAHATDGRQVACLHYPKYEPGKQQWPAAILNRESDTFPADWSRWQKLAIDLYVEAEKKIRFKVQLDSEDARRNMAHTVEPGRATTIEMQLSRFASEVDITDVRRMHLYMTRPPRPATVYVDNIRLIATPLDCDDLQFITDPFHSGQAGIIGSIDRHVEWAVQVVAGDDHPVLEASGRGKQIDWQWDGKKRDGHAVVPGEYRILVRLVDPQWPELAKEVVELGRTRVLPVWDQPDTVLWQEPTTKKVMLHSRPDPETPVYEVISGQAEAQSQSLTLTVDMARNEYEGTQLVVLTRRETNLQFQMSRMERDSGEAIIPAANIDIMQVGYAKTDAPPQYNVEHVGWWPDPLMPSAQIPDGEMTAQPYECMPVWIRARVDAETPAGVYTGSVQIRQAGDRLASLPIQVTVHDATLPDSTTIRTAFTLDRNFIRRTYGDEFDRDLLMKYYEFIAEHRINPDDIYRRDVADIDVLQHFAKQDQLNAFNVRYLRRGNGHKWDDARLKNVARQLDPFVKKLRETGLMDRAYMYGFDEVSADHYDDLRKVGQFFEKRYPEIPFATTARDHTYGIESGLDVVDIWVPLTPHYDRELAEKARERGKHVWWYICIGPRHPYANWFVEYPAIEPRLLWWMAYQKAVEGFLYYRMTRWPNADAPMTIDGGNKTDWDPDSYKGANGDGCLICAGPEGPITTIRIENIRDGIEDHELLTMLQKKRGDDGEEGRWLCGRLIASLTEFTHDTGLFSSVRQKLLKAAAGESGGQ